MASDYTALASLMPIGLNEVSRRLGVDPFETVRLLVATGHDLSGPMAFSEAIVETLQEQGGVHASWWDPAALPTGDGRSVALVHQALKALLDKGYIGDKTTRMDNVWRGLSFEDQSLLQQALTVLTEEGLVRCVGTPVGLQVAVDAFKEAAVKGIASGKKQSAGLDALLGG